jgi:hypothetical protein
MKFLLRFFSEERYWLLGTLVGCSLFFAMGLSSGKEDLDVSHFPQDDPYCDFFNNQCWYCLPQSQP